MPRKLVPALGAFALTLSLFASGAYAQISGASGAQKPAPVIVRFHAHGMGANDFQVARSKHREIELEIKKKGIDLAFTEWMQRDHPYVFARECVKENADMITDFKSTNHMEDFDALLPKRTDLRLNSNKYGHDVAFAEWLRTERPDVYRAHFGLDKDNRPVKLHKSGK